MIDLFASDDDLINKDEVAGIADSQSHKKRNDFKPWHKPRKQWVRRKQWWFHLERLINEYQEIECLKYFGLPGGDLLDVEYIRQRLEASAHDKNILMHGFISDENDKRSAESRLTELLDAPNFDIKSKVEKFNFGTLENIDSLGWNNVKSMGPYHFINLDFCDCVFKEETLNSVHKLMDFQLRRQLDVPWLFCITTRVDRHGVNQELISRLDDVLEALHSNEEILNLVKACFDAACNAIENSLRLSSSEIEGGSFSELLQVCLIFWVIVYALEHDARITLKSSMKYTIDGGNGFPDMLSLVFLIENVNVPLADPTGLVASNEATPIISLADQLECKLNAITKLSDSLNIDEFLAANDNEKRQCIDDSKSLLDRCGWDTTHYERDVVN